MKKWINPSCIVVIISIGCIVLLGGGGLKRVSAYQSHQNRLVNKISTGDNTSHIEEEFTPPEEVQPDTGYKKTVTVKNDTDTECYVRVFVEVSDLSVPVTIQFDTTYWTQKNQDGYYYYKTPLKKQEQTKPLFTNVTTGKTTDKFKIIVYEETVQASGFKTWQEAFASIR